MRHITCQAYNILVQILYTYCIRMEWNVRLVVAAEAGFALIKLRDSSLSTWAPLFHSWKSNTCKAPERLFCSMMDIQTDFAEAVRAVPLLCDFTFNISNKKKDKGVGETLYSSWNSH